MTKLTEWIGVDLDGTLANYEGWNGIADIGKPIPKMLNRVKNWLDEGREVKIFTARVSAASVSISGGCLKNVRGPIERWCLKYVGRVLPITCEKDLAMTELWDDRCIQVVPNTGERVDGL